MWRVEEICCSVCLGWCGRDKDIFNRANISSLRKRCRKFTAGGLKQLAPEADLQIGSCSGQGIALCKAVLTLGAVICRKASLLYLFSHRALIAAVSLCSSEFHQTSFLLLFLIWMIFFFFLQHYWGKSHQLHVRNSWKEEQSHLFSMSMKACTRINGCILHQERFRLGTASNGEESKAHEQTARGQRILHHEIS